MSLINATQTTTMGLELNYWGRLSNNHFLEDGSIYSGSYHISHEDGKYYTGGKHTDESLPIYFKDHLKGDVKEELILYSHKNLKNTRLQRTIGKTIRRKI